MTRCSRKTCWLALLLGVALLSTHRLQSQAVPGAPTGPQAPKALGVPHAPPKPPLAGCPQVELFRHLLDMNPAQRRQFLAPRPEPIQKLILAKVSEYEALRPAERELRLQATEMWWYLRPLLSASATNRQEQLAAIPVKVRTLVADRLRAWDHLPPAEQQRLMASAADYLARQAARVVSPPPLPPVPPDRRALLEQGVRQWQELSEWERQDITNRLNRLFDLTDQEKARVLNVLSHNQRRQIEKVLEEFENLTRDQRALCIQNFEKFADLSVPERDRFLKNAEHWRQMTPAQRANWKDLVDRLPPLPPGMNAPGLPPMPPAPPPPSTGQAMVGPGH
jgi:Protein of unknown function (DUF3106)